MIDAGPSTFAETHHPALEPREYDGVSGDISAPYTLGEQEKRLIGDIEAFLDASFPEEGNLVRERFASLEALGIAVARFPSVRAGEDNCDKRQKHNAPTSSTRDDFLESLISYSHPARLLRLPTRALGAHSYLIAKCHAFTFVSTLTGDIEAFYKPLRQVVFSITCILLAEEVYFSCMEDPAFPREVKNILMDDLVSFWDHQEMELSTAKHRSALESLWTIRDASPPSFGTMDGSSELVRISLGTGEDWSEFIMARIDDMETRDALEEFLFGLSYEEIQKVRVRLSSFNILAVNHDEVRSFLGTPSAYTMTKNTDPRAIYDFYVERRNMAVCRIHSGAPGPKKTLEEMYLRFRLTRKTE
jgi:hypothetical protein